MTFGNKLRELRNGKGWPQKVLADRIGVAQSAVARWEAGQQIPAFNLVQSICETLGVKCTAFDGCEYAEAEPGPVGRPRKTKPEAIPSTKPAAKRKKGGA